MSKGVETRQKKEAYAQKLKNLIETYKSILVVNLDNVGSQQMNTVRHKLRGRAVVLVGKNSTIRLILKQVLEENPKIESLISLVRGNIGFVFTNEDLKEINERVTEDRVNAPVKIGAISPVDVIIPAGGTGIDSAKTTFFQALGIATKVVKGAVEILSNVTVLKQGQKVGPSERALLNMMDISPFTYGLSTSHIYSDGSVFPASLLDISEEDVLKDINDAISNVAALSLGLGLPCAASAPHMIANAFMETVALALGADVCFKQAAQILEKIKNPGCVVEQEAAAPVEEAPAPQPEEESEEEMEFDLFD